jgi:hypothetical protein
VAEVGPEIETDVAGVALAGAFADLLLAGQPDIEPVSEQDVAVQPLPGVYLPADGIGVGQGTGLLDL